MKATALAHPNIALVKYWGKRNAEYNLPAAGSLSMTLGGLHTRTTVSFGGNRNRDALVLDGQQIASGAEAYRRVVDFLDLVRARAELSLKARVVSDNTFPTGAGLASSASGFAALAVAAAGAAALDVPARELSVLARRGSGSAARSIFGGYVEMRPGRRRDGEDAHATPVADSDHWDLRCLIAVTSRSPKRVGSTRGMTHTQQTSPFYSSWIDSVPADLDDARQAILGRDFAALGDIAQANCLRMHASAMAAKPGILYWNATTVEVLQRVREARDGGLPVFFTVDAGPQVKVFCPASAARDCQALLSDITGVSEVLTTHPGPAAHLIEADA